MAASLFFVAIFKNNSMINLVTEALHHGSILLAEKLSTLVDRLFEKVYALLYACEEC